MPVHTPHWVRSILVIGAGWLIACTVLAADDIRSISIPSGELAVALDAVARQYGLEILYRPDQIQNVQTAGVAGTMHAEDAVRKLLEGTPFTLRRDESGAILVALPRVGARPSTVELPVFSQARVVDIKPMTVEVTGSRIARPELDRLQPTVVVTSETFEDRAYGNVIDALNELPAFGPPGNSPAGAQPSSFGVAQSFADFLSLGSQRTLTLVNGRRFVGSHTASIFGPTNEAGQQVDLNVIPTKLIDRVETIAVGGAPVYGADAIAGTINVILKRDFEGFDVDALSGISDRGDGFNWRLRMLAGTRFADGRGNITANAEYTSARGLLSTERAATNRGYYFTDPIDEESPFALTLISNRRFNAVSFGGIPLFDDSVPHGAGITDSQGNVLQFAPDGQLVPYDFGTPTGNVFDSSGGDGIAFAQLTNLLAPTQRALFTTLANFRINDKVRAFGEGWFSNTRGTRLANQPVYNTVLFGNAGSADGNLIMSLDNPFLPESSRAIIRENLVNAAVPDPSLFYLTRGHTDIQSGLARSETDLHRLVAGLDGDVDWMGQQLQWEVSTNYGRSKTRSREPRLVQQNFLNAIDAVVDRATGEIVCRGSLSPEGLQSAPVPTFSSTCAPLNVFGLGAPSKAARDYITTLAGQVSTITQRTLTAEIGGAVLDVPAGSVQAVVGYENRHETSRFEPDQYFREAHGRSIPLDPLSGEFETNEVFAEALVPVVSPQQRIPWVHTMQFEGALREVDHSTAGSDTTWTAGLRFAPFADLHLRGNITRAIRAPAITELFNPATQAFATANDPCDARYIKTGPNPEQRAANCVTDGITQPFRSNIVDFTVPISVSGNQNLLNEKADSSTWGFVFRPRGLPGLSFAVDWIKIDLTNAVEALDAETVLEACYDSPDPDTSPHCASVERDELGQVIFVRTGFGNVGSVSFKGVTAQLSYEIDAPSFGRLAVDLNYFKLRDLVSRVGSGDIDTRKGEIGNSEDQAVLRLKYRKRDFTWLLQAQYLGEALHDADEPAGTRDVPGVGDWWLFNTTLGYSLRDNLSVRAVIDNVFDRGPPFPAPGGGGTITYYEGIFGRSYALSVSCQF